MAELPVRQYSPNEIKNWRQQSVSCRRGSLQLGMLCNVRVYTSELCAHAISPHAATSPPPSQTRGRGRMQTVQQLTAVWYMHSGSEKERERETVL